MSDRTRLIALAEALLAAIVWGGSFIATKVAVGEVSPATVVWLRFGMGVIVLGAAVVWRRQWAWVTPGELAYFALLGFLGITFHQWLQANALVTSQATTTAWIVAATPVFMALLGWLVLKERLGWARVAGIALAALGVLLVVTRGDFGMLARGQFGAPGDILVLISAPNWAVFSVLSRRGLRAHPPARMMLYVMATGWLFAGVWLVAGGGPGLSELQQLSPGGWGGVLFLGVVCSGLAYIFWYDALHVVPASQIGVFLYTEPLVAVAVAAVVLSEPILPLVLLGGATIIVGVWLVNRTASRDGRQ